MHFDLLFRQEQISESHNMERFLSVSLGLMGTTPLESARLDMYHTAWTDMMAMFTWRVWRVSDEESKRQGVSDFWAEFPKFFFKKKTRFDSGEVSSRTILLRISSKSRGFPTISLRQRFANLTIRIFSRPYQTSMHSRGLTDLLQNGFHRPLT